MFLPCVMTFVTINLLSVGCDRIEETYPLLPPIFHIDDYKKCKEESKTFCTVSVVLTPSDVNNPSEIWKAIDDTKNNSQYYNHDELFHAICTNDFCPNYRDSDKLNDTLTRCYTEKYLHLGLKAKVTQINCDEEVKFKIRLYDYILLILLIMYISLVIFSSYFDYTQKNFISNKKGKIFIKAFSLISNWKKLNTENKSVDFQKLKCMQGIRFYNTLLVIFCHTFCSYAGGYVENTIYFEQIEFHPIKHLIRNLLGFLVQTFFLFSAWLLSYHFFQLIGKTTVSMKRYVILSIFNRYLRIIPPLLVMIGIGYSVWIFNIFYSGPIKRLYSDVEFERCQKTWWSALLFVNNICTNHDMCYFITWYLSADMQLYIASLFIFVFMWKIRSKFQWIMAISVIIGMVVPGVIGYINNLDIIYRLTPEHSKIGQFRTFEFNAIYVSTYSNTSTYMIGIWFGYIYYKYRNVNIVPTRMITFMWSVLFAGLPLLVLFAACFRYNTLNSALLTSILKPVFAIGIGIGILGMSQKLGGIVRRVCEWKPALFMANFTYSTYIVHYALVFHRTSSTRKLLHVSDFILGMSFAYDAIVAFIFGFLMHILVEMPASQLQNEFVPQIRHKRQTDKYHKS